jgi:hypothetical protein
MSYSGDLRYASEPQVKFARLVFRIAGVWGIVLLAPLYFMLDLIGAQDPPPITHPGFFYGFVGVALAWQVAFFIIARDPVRFRPMMIPSILEKVAYGGAMTVLYLQGRMHAQDLAFGLIDLLFAALFALAYVRTQGPAAISRG